MADFTQKPNRGALFKNRKKEAATHADYNGSINVDGRDWWINAWLETSKGGQKYMSLSVKPKDGAGAEKTYQGELPTGDMDDGIPW